MLAFGNAGLIQKTMLSENLTVGTITPGSLGGTPGAPRHAVYDVFIAILVNLIKSH